MYCLQVTRASGESSLRGPYKTVKERDEIALKHLAMPFVNKVYSFELKNGVELSSKILEL